MNVDLNSPIFTVSLPICVTLIVAVVAQIWQNKAALGQIDNRIGDLSKRIDDLGSLLNKRIDDLASEMRAGFEGVNRRIDETNARVDRLENRLDLISPLVRR